MRIRTDFPYETTHVDVRIPLPDGTLLYARIWRPVTDEPVPALLEYLPYRLTDWTAPRDWQRHPWYAGHGYASVRVDVRGHGNSEGLPGDEYDARELADGVAVVDWLAAQPWCDGKVGMFGISWGGFNSLQIAALAPEPLKAVVTVCSSDDRYDNDVHYLGGSVLAVDMHAWAATMLAFTARPPDPAYVGDQWRDMWLTRLEAMEPYIHTWLAHQTRDDYWKHGSVREDYGAIGAAVLAVGGWHDPYRDTVLRLVEHLPADRVRGLIGPWSHQYPDRGCRRDRPSASSRRRCAGGTTGSRARTAGSWRSRCCAPGSASRTGPPRCTRSCPAAGSATRRGPRRTSPPSRTRSGAPRSGSTRRSTPAWTRAASSRSATTATCRRTSAPRTRTRRRSTSRCRTTGRPLRSSGARR